MKKKKNNPSVRIITIPRKKEKSPGSEWKKITPNLRWKCLMCGDCCRRPYRVNITWVEFKRSTEDKDIRKKFRIDGVIVDPETGLSHPFFNIDDGCPFLDKEKNICTIYEKRFYTCATWPFLLNFDGRILYSTECPGFGHGQVIDPWVILDDILIWREKAGMITEEERILAAKRWIEKVFGVRRKYITEDLL